MDERTEQFVIEQMDEVQAQHPNLELQRDSDGTLWVRGAVRFSREYNSRTVEDCYQLEIGIPSDYPASPPSVFETEKKIPRDFEHFMEAGELCLEAPVEVRRRFAEHRNLLRFIDDQVIPYLFACSYKRDYLVLPFGERKHGSKGLLEYYMEFFEATGIAAMKLLKCLADDWAPPLMACPCESGSRLRDCHGPKLDALRPHLSQRQFDDELLQIIELAPQLGVHLPESQVMPERVLRQKRRRLRRSNRRRGCNK